MKLLCICTGNTCRSPMAAALLRRELAAAGRTDVEVESAGLSASGEPASQGAVQAMAEWDIDLSGHLSRPVTAALCEEAEYIYTMTPLHAAVLQVRFAVPAEKLTVLGEGIPDPFGGTLDDYRLCRDALQKAVKTAVENLPK